MIRNLIISEPTEDAYCASGGTPQGGTYVQIGDDTSNYLGFLRFQIPLSRGAKISNAALWVYLYDAWLGDFTPTVYCEDVDNSAAFGGSEDLTARTKTTAYRGSNTGSGAAGYAKVFSVIEPLQEVLDRSGWVANNYATLIMTKGDYAKGDDPLRIAALEHATYNPALLWIQYQTGSGGGAGLLML